MFFYVDFLLYYLVKANLSFFDDSHSFVVLISASVCKVFVNSLKQEPFQINDFRYGVK